jgi:hypothetical protein
MKLTEKIKNKLRIWLGIIHLEIKCGHIETDCKVLERDIESNKRDIFRLIKRIDKTNDKIDSTAQTLRSVVSIGADVYENKHDRNNSWAVVCIGGKLNVVKFIDLDRGDAMGVLSFLKQFEISRHVIDTPHRMMFDEFFKFD